MLNQITLHFFNIALYLLFNFIILQPLNLILTTYFNTSVDFLFILLISSIITITSLTIYSVGQDNIVSLTEKQKKELIKKTTIFRVSKVLGSLVVWATCYLAILFFK